MSSADPAGGLSTDPYADQPDRKTLVDESGRAVLVFSPTASVPEALPWADAAWMPPGVGTTAAAGLVRRAMGGWLLSTSDPRLATALLAGGAATRRHALVLTRALEMARSQTHVGETGAGRPETFVVRTLSPAQLSRHAERLAGVHRRAYPSGHPDAREWSEAAAGAQLRAIADGDVLGPMIADVSTVAVAPLGIVGACLVVDRAGSPPHGGPWVVDVFRDPGYPVRGVGQALLESSVRCAAAAGLPAVSLAVSAANGTARAVYARLGFSRVEESWTLALQ